MTDLRDPFPPLPAADMIDSSQITDLGNVKLRGDIRSFNWNGGSDLSGGADPDATAGFFFDSSQGTIQLEGEMFVGGDVTLDGGTFYTNDTLPLMAIFHGVDQGSISFYRDIADSNPPFIAATDNLLGMFSRKVGATDEVAQVALTREAVVGQPGVLIAAGSGAQLHLNYPGTVGQPDVHLAATTGGGFLQLMDIADQPDVILNSGNTNAILIWPDANVVGIEVRGEIHQNADGTVSAPVYSWRDDRNTGILRSGAGAMGFTSQGSLKLTVDGTGFFFGSNSGSAAVTTVRHVFNTDGWAWHTRSGASPLFVQRTTSDGELITFIRTSTVAGGIGITAGTLTLYASSSMARTLSILDGGTGSSVFMRDGLTDVGNHETLRLDRGSGAAVAAIGYFSSWLVDPVTGKRAKRDLIDLADSPRFPGLDVIDQIRTYDYKRVSTKQREWGFTLDNFKEISEDLRYLTTKGDRWGHSPDEHAINALQMLAIQDLRRRVSQLEGAA